MARVTFQGELRMGRLERRYKRFFVDAVLDGGERITAHTPNTGGMLGLLDVGNRVLLSHAPSPKRKLDWSLQAIHTGSSWVGTNPILSNRLVAEAVHENVIPDLLGYGTARREAPFVEGNTSRVDLLLTESRFGEPDALVEVKSATMRMGDIAVWPDAPSERGRKHLDLLRRAVREGRRGVLLFLVPRTDCRAFAPAVDIDPAYAEALYEAYEEGVEIIPLVAAIDDDGPGGMRVTERLPVQFIPSTRASA